MKDKIFTAFLSSRDYLRPFLSEGQTLRGFLDSLSALGLVDTAGSRKQLACIQTAANDVGLIKGLYSEASQTSLQNAVSLIRRLQEPSSDSKLLVHLNLLLNKPSTLELQWKPQQVFRFSLSHRHHDSCRPVLIGVLSSHFI